MKLTERSVHDLLGAFRSSDPTPGGGSAAALSGAIGASLLAMVAGLPKPAAATPGDLAILKTAGEKCAALAIGLEELIDRDSRAYDDVMAAYRLPKGTEDEKSARSRAIQAALRAATEAPLDVMRACADAIVEAAAIARLGNPNASSDVAVGLELLQAGRRGARVNVEINLPGLKEVPYVEHVRSELQRLG
jgi:formiminotetrahydrofolate cyclodeaminase